jgi:hypothetical protein
MIWRVVASMAIQKARDQFMRTATALNHHQDVTCVTEPDSFTQEELGVFHVSKKRSARKCVTILSYGFLCSIWLFSLYSHYAPRTRKEERKPQKSKWAKR